MIIITTNPQWMHDIWQALLHALHRLSNLTFIMLCTKKTACFLYSYSISDTRCTGFSTPRSSSFLGGHQLGVLQFNPILTLTGVSADLTSLRAQSTGVSPHQYQVPGDYMNCSSDWPAIIWGFPQPSGSSLNSFLMLLCRFYYVGMTD